MKIVFSTMDRLHSELKTEMMNSFEAVYDKGWFIDGEQCKNFEREFADFCDAKYCIGCSNGLDAIHLMLKAVGINKGDEVIVPSNTFIATVLAVSYSGATPVLVEPDINTYVISAEEIEKKITNKTKAVIVVDLYGQLPQIEKIYHLCKERKLWLFEDAAQAHGASYKGKPVGYYSDAAAFSFYPGKNLGALGDAGALITNNEEIAKQVRALGNYGSVEKYKHDVIGFNNRLDEVQASLLRVKLSKLDEMTKNRQYIANRYLTEIKNDKIILPIIGKDCTHVWHIFAIRVSNRNEFKKYLEQFEIQTVEHYPIPIHKQEAYQGMFEYMHVSEIIAEQEVSLPVFYGMTDEEITYVIDKINKY